MGDYIGPSRVNPGSNINDAKIICSTLFSISQLNKVTNLAVYGSKIDYITEITEI